MSISTSKGQETKAKVNYLDVIRTRTRETIISARISLARSKTSATGDIIRNAVRNTLDLESTKSVRGTTTMKMRTMTRN